MCMCTLMHHCIYCQIYAGLIYALVIVECQYELTESEMFFYCFRELTRVAWNLFWHKAQIGFPFSARDKVSFLASNSVTVWSSSLRLSHLVSLTVTFW